MTFSTEIHYKTDGGVVILHDRGGEYWYMHVKSDTPEYSSSLRRLVVLVIKNRTRAIVSDIHDNFELMLRLAKKLGAIIYEDNSIAFQLGDK